MNKKIAFTLAEVVIAVAIIGTLATLTINTYFVDGDSQKNQYVAGLKKVYAELSYATDRIKTNNSGTMKYFSGFAGGNPGTENNILNEYGKYLKFSKTCNIGDASCWHSADDYFYLTGDPVGDDLSSYPNAILSDGTLISFLDISYNCDLVYNTCGGITIDVNGFKGPNTMGRDIFIFYISPNSIIPAGDSSNNDCNTGEDGAGCAGIVLEAGKMLY